MLPGFFFSKVIFYIWVVLIASTLNWNALEMKTVIARLNAKKQSIQVEGFCLRIR